MKAGRQANPAGMGPALQHQANQLNQGDSDISDEDFGDVDENIVTSNHTRVTSGMKNQNNRTSNEQAALR